MEYLKKWLNSIKEILIYEIVMLLTIIIVGLLILLFNNDISTDNITVLLNKYTLYPIVIITIIMIYIFYRKHLKNSQEVKQYDKKYTLYFVILGVSIALIMNIIFLFLNNYIKIYDNVSIKSISIYTAIFITGIIGPIIEEILFRGILFNKLKTFNSLNKSMIYSTIVFAISHDSIIEFIYAFILGLILVFFYNKYKNILVPIIIHISANIIIILYQTTILKINPILISFMFILSIISLYISVKELTE